MQRIPSGRMPSGQAQPAEEPSPLLRLARRIREEQGSEQVRAFLAAMAPFAAPNEIRRVGESFGISRESLEYEMQKRAPQPQKPQNTNNQQSMNGMMNQLNQLRTIMQLSGMLKNGGDPSALLNLLGGK